MQLVFACWASEERIFYSVCTRARAGGRVRADASEKNAVRAFFLLASAGKARIMGTRARHNVAPGKTP